MVNGLPGRITKDSADIFVYYEKGKIVGIKSLREELIVTIGLRKLGGGNFE